MNPDKKGVNLFHKAYVSMSRLEGKCNLTVILKGRGGKKELEVHTFLLFFNHTGIKEYKQKKVRCPGGSEPSYLHVQGREYIELTLQEAVSLLQDSYRQNIRFGTRPAPGYANYSFMLEYDTSSLDRGRLLARLSLQYLAPRMVANVYLTALRKMDNGLLYDLSGSHRRALLGDRTEFLEQFGEEYRELSFIKTGIVESSIENDVYTYKAYAIVGTPREELIRLKFSLNVRKAGDGYYVDKFTLTNREAINGEHPDNPLNYEVFCTVYRLNDRGEAISRWLEKDPEIFLIGEVNDQQCYKWIENRDVAWLEYDITDRLMAEFIVNEQELFIYTKKPHQLVRVERITSQNAAGSITGYKRLYLPVRKLYEHLFTGEQGKPISMRKAMQRYGAESALVYLGQDKVTFDSLQKSIEFKVMLGPKCWYLFCRNETGKMNEPSLTEYYIAGKWLLVNVIKGDPEEQLSVFRKISGTAVIHISESDNNGYSLSGLSGPSVSEQQKWQIYGLLNQFRKEGGLLREMGLAPSLREVVGSMGSLIRSLPS